MPAALIVDASLLEVLPRLGRLDAGLLEGRDVVPDGRLVGALEHDAVLRAVDRADVGDRLAERVDDRLAQVVDRLDRVLLGEVGHQPRLADRCDVGRVPSLDGGGEQRREVVAAGRVLDGDVRIQLREAVDHGLERRLLVAAPDRHHRERSGDVLAPLGAAAAVVTAATCRHERERAHGERQCDPSVSHRSPPRVAWSVVDPQTRFQVEDMDGARVDRDVDHVAVLHA